MRSQSTYWAIAAVGVLLATAATARSGLAAKAASTKPGYSKPYDACMAKALSTLDMVNCNSSELAARTLALDTAYAGAMERVDGAKAALKAAERAWISYRDADCGVYENRDAFGTLGEIEAGQCMIDRTIERTKALRAFAPDPSAPN